MPIKSLDIQNSYCKDAKIDLEIYYFINLYFELHAWNDRNRNAYSKRMEINMNLIVFLTVYVIIK